MRWSVDFGESTGSWLSDDWAEMGSSRGDGWRRQLFFSSPFLISSPCFLFLLAAEALGFEIGDPRERVVAMMGLTGLMELCFG